MVHIAVSWNILNAFFLIKFSILNKTEGDAAITSRVVVKKKKSHNPFPSKKTKNTMQYRTKSEIMNSVVYKNEHPVSCRELCCRRGSGTLSWDPNIITADNLIPLGSTRRCFCGTE